MGFKKHMGLKMAHEPKMMAMSHAFLSRFVLVVVYLTCLIDCIMLYSHPDVFQFFFASRIPNVAASIPFSCL